MHVWVRSNWGAGVVNCARHYASEAAMKSAVCRMLKKRAPGPMATIDVYAKWGPYSGPDVESYMGRAGFDGDGDTAKFFPAGTL